MPWDKKKKDKCPGDKKHFLVKMALIGPFTPPSLLLQLDKILTLGLRIELKTVKQHCILKYHALFH